MLLAALALLAKAGVLHLGAPGLPTPMFSLRGSQPTVALCAFSKGKRLLSV